MKQSQSFALIAVGPVSKSFLSRLPGLHQGLGPVYAGPYRVASRLVNSLRAGTPVPQLDEAVTPKCLLVAVSEGSVAGLVRDMAVVDVDWQGKTVLLCSEYLDSGNLSPLESLGAFTASLSMLPGFDETRLLAEGSVEAVRDARRLFAHGRVQLVELRPRGKATYLAGVTFATSLFTPLIEAAAQSFREAGLSPALTSQLLERTFQESLRGYLHARRKSWSGPLARNQMDLVHEQLEALHRASPVLAGYFQVCAEHSLKLLQDGVSCALASEEAE
jgi:predicted short-subunit dehydrogenase-like oxidoreductase (DUF2520 family)